MPETQADIHQPQKLPALAMAGDIAVSLPAPARKKLKSLRAAAEIEWDTRRRLNEKRQVLMEGVAGLRDEIEAMTLPLKSMSRRSRPGRGLPEDSGEVKRARLQLDSLTEDLDEANAIYGNRAANSLRSLVSRVEEYVRRSGRAILGVAAAESVTLRKGETVQSAVENRRRRIRELRDQLNSVSRAPWPSRIAKEKSRAQIAELQVRGRPDVFGLVERGRPIEWPTLPDTVSAELTLPQFIREPIDAAALIAWALGPILIDAIDREIDELSDDERALTSDQRRAKTLEIVTDMLVVEREEETLIEMAEAEGLRVPRRSDADPRAVLGIVSDIAPGGH